MRSASMGMTHTLRTVLADLGLEPVELLLVEGSLADVLAALAEDARATVPPPAGAS